MNRRLLIFDVEGTLIDCVRQTLICWSDTFASYGFKFSLEQLQYHSGRDPDDMIRMLLPADAERLAEPLKQAQGSCYRERFLPDVRAFAGVRPLFETLKQSGAIIALATTCAQDQLRHYLRVAQISDLVDHVACGEDVAQEKPHPDLINLALDRAKCRPGASVMIGDTPYDALAARTAGVAAIGLLTGGFTALELKSASCTAVYSDVSALLNSGELLNRDSFDIAAAR
jgi:HAD superfamily hydrolase (TIGR01549 family)